MENRQKILENINAVFSKVYETAIHSNDLRVAVDNIDNKDSAILMEFSFLNDRELGNTSLLQIYTTLSFNFNTEFTDELLDRINELSIKCSIGNFGLHKDLKHIFHRYTMYVKNAEEISSVYDVSLVAQRIISILKFLYDYITVISENPSEITLDEYLKKNYNQN